MTNEISQEITTFEVGISLNFDVLITMGDPTIYTVSNFVHAFLFRLNYTTLERYMGLSSEVTELNKIWETARFPES